VKKNKLKIVASFLLLLVTMIGCSSGPSPEEEVYETLEKVVSLEESFKDQQDPLVELEKSEKAIYDEIISLSAKDFDKIVSLSTEAISLVEERETRINNEHESIQSAKTEFETVDSHIEKIEDTDLKKEAEGLIELMNRRYTAYEELYTNYINALTYDKELYQLFQNEDLSMETLEEQINLINESYEKVITANNQFNEITDAYNKAKVKFYENAELNIVYE
jgi:hypothetical protein